MGSVSLTVALPILTALNYEVWPVPSEVLSSHTGGFGQPATLTNATWLEKVFHHWQEQQLVPDQVLIGYIGQIKWLDQLCQGLAAWPTVKLLCDPAMGDEGHFYQGLNEHYVQHLRLLLPYTDWLTPNITEAQLLVGKQPQEKLDRSALRQIMLELTQQLKPGGQVIVTSVTDQDDNIGCAWLSGTQLHTYLLPRLTHQCFGTGDALSALLVGYLGQGMTLATAVKQATQQITVALKSRSMCDPRLGIGAYAIISQILNVEGQAH